MGYSVEWANAEKTIVLQTYSGYVKTDEYYQAVDESALLLSSVEHPVDLIMDGREAKTENGKGFLMAVSYANKKVPKNQRLVLMVGAGLLIRTMGKITRSIAPRATENIYFVNTVEEAYKLIEEHQQSSEHAE